ncbi:TetR family transcriptional regulator [Paenibacillus sp. MCAF20]
MARRTKAETNETIHTLTAIARRHFTEYGYADAALELIVQEANLTRGAVYHHFRSKKELFRSVLESVQREVAQRVERDASTSEDVWEEYVATRAGNLYFTCNFGDSFSDCDCTDRMLSGRRRQEISALNAKTAQLCSCAVFGIISSGSRARSLAC